MKLVKLHNGTWIDAHDVDVIEPKHGCSPGGPWSPVKPHTKIRMKSGNEVLLFPRGSLQVGFSAVLQETEDLVKEISEANQE